LQSFSIFNYGIMSFLLFLFLQRTNFVPKVFYLQLQGLGSSFLLCPRENTTVMSIRITNAARTAQEQVQRETARARGMQS
jgi:hypothetical protein